MKSRSLLLVCLSLIAVSCVSSKSREVTPREPANEETRRAELDVLGKSKDVSAGLVLDRNSEQLHALLHLLKEAQGVVSAFDAKTKAARNADELERLNTSRLYCVVQTARQDYEDAMERLEIALASASGAGDSKAVEWYFQLVSAFARHDATSRAAMGHYVRRLVANEAEVCGARDCARSMLSPDLANYLKDSEFNRFLEQNAFELSSYRRVRPTDVEAGSCMQVSGREPNQAAPFVWNQRNWIKSNTNPGQFIITYDDGPHARNTEQLMAVWNESKLPKPTFFWQTSNSGRYESIVAKARQQGFPIGCHSERHIDIGNVAGASSFAALNRVNRKVLANEIAKTPASGFAAWKQKTLQRELVDSPLALQASVRKADPNFKIRYYRLPFGSGVGSATIGSLLNKNNLDHFFWAVDSLDWQDSSSSSVLARVLGQMKTSGRGLILFHDIQDPTVATTKMLIQTVQKSPNYKFVSIEQMTK